MSSNPRTPQQQQQCLHSKQFLVKHSVHSKSLISHRSADSTVEQKVWIYPKLITNFFSVEDLFFTKSHEWISKDGYMGITHHAQDGLGEITHVDFQVNVGDTVSQGDCICVVESIKTVSDVYAPVSGKIQEVNEDLMDDAK